MYLWVLGPLRKREGPSSKLLVLYRTALRAFSCDSSPLKSLLEFLYFYTSGKLKGGFSWRRDSPKAT